MCFVACVYVHAPDVSGVDVHMHVHVCARGSCAMCQSASGYAMSYVPYMRAVDLRSVLCCAASPPLCALCCCFPPVCVAGTAAVLYGGSLALRTVFTKPIYERYTIRRTISRGMGRYPYRVASMAGSHGERERTSHGEAHGHVPRPCPCP